MARIYLSSTFQDLKDHREEVARSLRQLRHEVVGMEEYVADGSRPLAKCLRDIAGDTITQTQSAVVLESLISQFLFNKAADAGGEAGAKK